MTVAMPAVKPVVTGCGMNWISRPSRATPIATSRKPARARRQQAREALARHDRREDDDERRGRPRDLELRAAGQRDHDPRDDRRVQAVLRRHADRDGERHRERQRDDADDEPREHVRAERRSVVALRERLSDRGADRQSKANGNRRPETRTEGTFVETRRPSSGSAAQQTYQANADYRSKSRPPERAILAQRAKTRRAAKVIAWRKLALDALVPLVLL